jgi:hypothetical protein
MMQYEIGCGLAIGNCNYNYPKFFQYKLSIPHSQSEFDFSFMNITYIISSEHSYFENVDMEQNLG